MTYDARPTLPCRDNPDLFFPPEGRHDTTQRVRDAKALCQACPIRAACRDKGRRFHAIGVWGGEDDDERTAALKGAASSPPAAGAPRQTAAKCGTGPS